MSTSYSKNPDFLEWLLRNTYNENDAPTDPFTDKAYNLDDEKLSRAYSGTGKVVLAKKFARFFYTNFDKIKFKNFLDYKLNGDQLDDLDEVISNSGYDFGDIDTSQKCAEILYDSLGFLADATKNKKATKPTVTVDLKAEFGVDLLLQEHTKCPNNGCTNRLLEKTDSGKTAYTYSIAVIDENENIEPNNLIALCPNCFAKFESDKSAEAIDNLKKIKYAVVYAEETDELNKDANIQAGIEILIRRLVEFPAFFNQTFKL